MASLVVADTGPLIALALVDLLPTLNQLFSQVVVPATVYMEATQELSKPGAQATHEAVKTGCIDVIEIFSFQIELATYLDQGEAEAISLAQSLNATLIIDERRGRKAAEALGITITGSAAILIKAKQLGLIDSVTPVLTRLQTHGYRLSNKLVIEILRRCNEEPS